MKIRSWSGINWASDTYDNKNEAEVEAKKERQWAKNCGGQGNRISITEVKPGEFEVRYPLGCSLEY